jgi:5-formyltetrahydrofolate cyclo-ligase
VAAEAVRDRVLAAVPLPAAAVVSAYWPLASEFDPRPLLFALHARGHACALPVVLAAGQPLQFRQWRPDTALEPNVFGVLAPGDTAAVLRPRVLLVPLLAFDRAGWRLGYGGGFYDRSLATLRAAGAATAVGVAFAAQEVDAVPHHDGDQRLDWVVTEREALQVAVPQPAPQPLGD